jgi:hypothetical protein
MEDHDDEVARAYSMLTALRKNVPKERHYVDEDYVHEYHKALDRLGQLGFDVKEFEIPQQWMEPVTHQVPEGEGYRTVHANRNQVEHGKFMTKLDAVLIYFPLTAADSSTAPGPIGFTGPRKK